MSMDEVTFNSQVLLSPYVPAMPCPEGRSSNQVSQPRACALRNQTRNPTISKASDFERITESARKVMGEAHPLIQ
eukprot:3671310-Rhodomonas_salina.1